MKLVIVESPNKCKKIQDFLGSGYQVIASVGHIREIPHSGTNIDIKNGFTPKFEWRDDKKDAITKIKNLSKMADEIFLASDKDREGESISSEVYDLLNKSEQKKCKRITFIEITKKAITDAINNPRDIDDDLVQAQKARQVLDRLIGYEASPLLWRGVGKGTSAGRVQSVALRLITDRQREIEAFKPTDFWYLDAQFKASQGSFWARCVTKDKDNRYLDEKLAQNDLTALKTATFSLGKIDKDAKSRKAYPPFDTSSLQTTASVVLGWDATKTMQVAQELYVAGRTTYIRSDSFAIAPEAVDEVRSFIKKDYGNSYLPQSKNIYTKKSTAAAQEAHECIRPTHIDDTGDTLYEDQRDLYQLIRDRFIACQMSDQIVDTVTYMVHSSTKHKLVAKGQSIRFDGWTKVWTHNKTKEEVLPLCTENEVLKLANIKSTKNSTKAPDRFNDKSLIEKMENDGVGRPSTRAQIIKALEDKGYVTRDKKAFVPTELGKQICDYLTPRFNDMFMDIKYTSEVENELDEIANGKKKYVAVVETVYNQLKEKVKKANMDNKENNQGEAQGAKCPVCGIGEVMKRNGKWGAWFTCSAYPDCKATLTKNEDGTFSEKKKAAPAKSTGKKCTKCKEGNIVERNGKFGLFLTCDAFPKCKTIYIEKDGKLVAK